MNRDRPNHRASRRARREEGFSIVESTIALGLIFTVLVGMLGSLSTGVRGVVQGRQRTGANAIAREVLELARSVGYDAVGHDLDSDSTLLDDDALLSSGTHQWTYNGEALAGSNRNQDPDSPFYPHRWTRTAGAVEYTVHTYVTAVVPGTGDPYKRVTAIVSWTNAQSGGGEDSMEASSFVFDAQEPPDPLLEGLADVDAGSVRVTGLLQGTDLDSAWFWFPTAHGETESRFIRRTNGLAVSPRSQLNVNNAVQADSDLTGCTVSQDKKRAECAGEKAESVADNDAGTAPADSSVVGPVTYSGGTVTRQSRLAITFDGTSSSTSESTAIAATPTFPENDLLPWHESSSSGPGSMSIPYDVVQVDGTIAECAAPATVTATVDVDPSGMDTKIASAATVTHPDIDVLDFDDVVYFDDGEGLAELTNYDGLVRLGTTDVTATAEAGPGAVAPTLSGSSLAVQMYDASGDEPGYSTVSFTPGVEQTASTSAQFVIEGRTVMVDATVTSAKSVIDSTVNGAVIDEASVSLTSWLSVLGHLKVYDGDGALVADLTIDVDYGRILTSALYEPA